jgi:hypothetical protein
MRDMKMINNEGYEINERKIWENINLEDKGIGSLSDFVDRVKEIHEYNVSQYPNENPTLEGAYEELLIDIIYNAVGVNY